MGKSITDLSSVTTVGLDLAKHVFHSLFTLGLGSASKGAANRDLVFLSQSWSRCPAEKWVPALLEGVWTRVSAPLHES
jgi:hypothetical protein